MKYKGIIFDLDGTLVDSLEDLANSVNGMLEHYNFPLHSIDAYQYFVGEGVIVLIKRALPPEFAADEDFVLNCLSIVNEEYMNRWSDKTRPYKGIPELLQRIHDNGIKIAVLSNKPHKFTTLIVPHFFPDIQFDVIFGAREGIPRKPDPTAAIEILEKLDLHPNQCVYVGDSNIDMKTGRAAGMFTVGVSWGFRPEKELREAGADRVISSPDEILEVLGL
ncbi:MAG TPA: HAD family hydrolase [Spirochaetota bacterium]